MFFIFLKRTLDVGLKGLWYRKLRSFLTILGIIFGVSSVITMLAIGEGASFETQQRIKEMGSHNIIIQSVKPSNTSAQANLSPTFIDKYGLLNRDFYKIKKIPTIKKISAVKSMNATVWHSKKHIYCEILGTDPAYFSIAHYHIGKGQFFNYIEYKDMANVAVLGAGVASKLFPYGGEIGKTIRVKQDYFRIIGIIKKQTLGGKTAIGNINNEVYIPFSTYRSYFGNFIFQFNSGNIKRTWIKINQLWIEVKNKKYIIPTSQVITSILKPEHPQSDYKVIIPLSLLQQAEQTKIIFNIVLGSIAAISLIVGGIGIMNIMLANVMERTREIGIRRALGAKKRDIIYQFLFEASILSSTGGILGIFLGLLVPILVTHFTGMKTIITLWSLLLAFFISVGIGIIFGLYPAKQASEMSPLSALRYE